MKGEKKMKIALINENSQCGKNSLIFETLKKVCEPKGHQVFNYGRFAEDDGYQRSYVQAGLLTGILINSGAADFVITGCGTGMGAMVASNSFPNVFCGFVEEPLDGYLYSQVNAGNAVSLPFNKGFGWGSDVKHRYIFERLFEEAPGGGFPKEWAQAERTNRNILTDVKKVTCRDMKEILKEIDPEFLKGTLEPKGTKEQIYENATDQELVDVIKALVE